MSDYYDYAHRVATDNLRLQEIIDDQHRLLVVLLDMLGGEVRVADSTVTALDVSRDLVSYRDPATLTQVYRVQGRVRDDA